LQYIKRAHFNTLVWWHRERYHLLSKSSESHRVYEKKAHCRKTLRRRKSITLCTHATQQGCCEGSVWSYSAGVIANFGRQALGEVML